jgi:hypothetical protein
MTVVLFHSGSFRVVETTYFGMAFSLSAKPMSSFLDGQASAKPS